MEKKSFWQLLNSDKTRKWFLAIIAGLVVVAFFIPPVFSAGKAITSWNLLGGGSGGSSVWLGLAVYLLPIVGAVLFIFRRKSILLSLAFFSELLALVLTLSLVFIANEFNSDSGIVYTFGIGLGVISGLLLVGTIYVLVPILDKSHFTVREISEISVLVALALVLDRFARIPVSFGGAGSINLGMIPLFLIAYRLNFSKSFLAIGVIFGLISCLLDNWGLYTFPFDYFLAYGAISFAGLFANLAFPKDAGKVSWQNLVFFVLSVFVGIFGRYIGSTISSVVIYGTTLVGGLEYNWYIWASGLVTLVILGVLYRPFITIQKLFPVKNH
jgi:thiamine transporter ThiT